MLQGIALFGTGLFVVVLAFSAVGVYLLDEFDPNLGRGTSLQTLIVVILGGRAVGTVGGRQIIAIVAAFGVSLLSAALLRRKRVPAADNSLQRTGR